MRHIKWFFRITLVPLLLFLFIVSKPIFVKVMMLIGWARKDIITDGELYLRRFLLTPMHWKHRYMLHHIILPDLGRDHHSHPWSFDSLILSGGYVESVLFPVPPIQTTERTHSFLSLVCNKAIHIHRIDHVKSNTWTLVRTGPMVSNWGFWVKKGNHYEYVNHKDYKLTPKT